jgi:hypothetical protein
MKHLTSSLIHLHRPQGLGVSGSHALTFSRSSLLAAFLLLLAGAPAKADTSFNGVGWLCAVPSFPGITVTNSAGQVFLKGNTHVVRILTDDKRMTGRLEAWMDLAYRPDGTAFFSGPAYNEVGAWDSAGTNFTPSGGVWALNYSGVVQPDGSSQYSMAGYGIGGEIEGLRFSGTMTRSNQEPATPYLGSGTIKPAPVNTRDVVDDFEDNQFTWSEYAVGPAANPNPPGAFFASETNRQLTIGGTWPATTPTLVTSCAWAFLDYSWAVSGQQTVEARVDVVGFSKTASAVSLNLYYLSGESYGVMVGRNYIAIGKQVGVGVAFFRVVQASIKDTNIVLSLAVTPVGGKVVLTGKVLDNAAGGAVIAQVVATDTPARDSTLSASELAALTGDRPWQGGSIIMDPIGPPHTSGTGPATFVFQQSDAAPVTAFATFDNLEFRTYEVPQVSCERTLRLSWHDTGMNFVVEGASDPNGPWTPVQSPEIPGVRYLTVPTSAPHQFFRAEQAP